ncbi:unnamed protein product [Orchesella dallaii]|uniref:FLYWCH-type domain-containing protein n=1 Tax=Orchesella dallaii TaxID=48710 RepID=A0ABP1QLV3_9HEXA
MSDSDFDGATDGVDVTGDKVEGVAAALNLPGPSTSIQKDQKTPKLEVESEVGGGHGRKNNDSSSSDEDDDDDDDSSESSDSIGDYVDLPPRRILRKLTYELSERFQNLDEAKAYVRGLQSWKINDYRTLANNNTKHNYICRFVKGCPARMYLLEHDTIDLYLSTTEHSHPPMVRKPFGMSEEVKAKINRLYRKGITGPVSLQKALKEAGLEEPTITQLTGYTRRIRDKIRAKISKRTRKANKGSCSVEMKLE